MLNNIFLHFLLNSQPISNHASRLLQSYNILYFSMSPYGIYIHIPFCRSKCLYCDFFSGGVSAAQWQTHREALLEELNQRSGEIDGKPDTIYIGGGTPSLMPDDEMGKLMEGIHELIPDTDKISEFTIEMNPEDVSLQRLSFYKSLGIDRFSVGIQSLNDSELSAVKRNHDRSIAIKALDLLATHTSNFSADLIFGLPEQTITSFRESLDILMAYAPHHVSLYSLMLEEGTPLTVLHNRNKLTLPGDDECVEMWQEAKSFLKACGYQHYEISNYARPGYEAIHNRRYWLGMPYMGLGPAAHSFDGENIRRANPADIKGYIKYYHRPGTIQADPFYIEEKITEEERKEEYVMLRMRMNTGINLEDFRNKWGEKAHSILMLNAGKDLKNGNLRTDRLHLSLTEAGLMMADSVITNLIL